MYIYAPMGLDRQHEVQKSILARFGSLELASCFIEVTSRQLDIGYLEKTCTCVIPKDSKKHGGIERVMEKWKTLTNTCRLKPCYDIEEEHFNEKLTAGWEDVKKAVKKPYGDKIEEALNLVDEKMNKIDEEMKEMKT